MGIIGTIAAVVIGGFLTLAGSYLMHRLETTRSERQERHRLYVQIIGLRAAMYHRFGFHGDASISCVYYGALARSAAAEPRHTYCDQKRQYWEDKTNEAATKCLETHVRLMETIGGVQLHFDRTDELDSLTRPLFDMKFLKLEPVENAGDFDMKGWKESLECSLASYLDRKIAEPIDALSEYLRDRIGK